VPFTYEPNKQTGEGLRIHLPQSSFTVKQRSPLTVHAIVLNGRAPYTATLRWGDKTQQTVTFKNGKLAFVHRFSTPGRYSMVLDVRDADGRRGSVFMTVQVRAARSILVIIGAFTLIILLIIIGSLYLYRRIRLRSRT